MGSRELSCVGAMERDCLQQPFTVMWVVRAVLLAIKRPGNVFQDRRGMDRGWGRRWRLL